ncbi:hypothetical protein CIN_21090 [Commensalibacter intestini A911]|uniref:Uncharacterized protein n=1 Tax=Commensalibacter intestini A911 TaxID=1088868 RepID=G6F3B3_9PROT|nr:hypothetical protein CIN_21090 [Commensalibacter intestini A911]
MLTPPVKETLALEPKTTDCVVPVKTNEVALTLARAPKLMIWLVFVTEMLPATRDR